MEREGGDKGERGRVGSKGENLYGRRGGGDAAPEKAAVPRSQRSSATPPTEVVRARPYPGTTLESPTCEPPNTSF